MNKSILKRFLRSDRFSMPITSRLAASTLAQDVSSYSSAGTTEHNVFFGMPGIGPDK
jgi:hypothetical protein